MAEESPRIGDRVQLKSGGPVMTVESVESDGDLICVWWASKQSTYRWREFDPKSVTVIDQESKS